VPGDGPLLAALADSQRLGMLGPLPVADVVAHSEAFVGALVGLTATVVDLGTGGGVPGLVIAWRRPDLSLVLVDRRTTRTDHVSRLVQRLGLAPRVLVVPGEAATLPRRLAGTAIGAVVARGYGPPSRVVHDAIPLLGPGGLLVVSEPPDRRDRWGDDLLEGAGLRRIDHDDGRVVVLRRNGAQ
jgi:16S rRNA (guanine527-N7)-methyltransferase